MLVGASVLGNNVEGENDGEVVGVVEVGMEVGVSVVGNNVGKLEGNSVEGE